MAAKRLLIVFHSQSGATRQLARAAYQGALRNTAIECRLLNARDADVDDLLWCDGVIFGSPENLGYLSGGLKDFFDRTFYPAQDYSLNLPYAAFISAGNDGQGAVRQLERIVRGYPFRKVAEAVIIRGEPDKPALASCLELGETLGAGLEMGIF